MIEILSSNDPKIAAEALGIPEDLVRKLQKTIREESYRDPNASRGHTEALTDLPNFDLDQNNELITEFKKESLGGIIDTYSK